MRREKGLFDPELFGSADWSGADTPSASLFAGADVLETESTDLAGRRPHPAADRHRAVGLAELAADDLELDFAALSPEYQSFGALTLRQPLLKGFGPAARSDLTAAERNRDGASARYDGALLAVRAEVETVYWELYAAERNHAVTTADPRPGRGLPGRHPAAGQGRPDRAQPGGQRRVLPDRGRSRPCWTPRSSWTLQSTGWPA